MDKNEASSHSSWHWLDRCSKWNLPNEISMSKFKDTSELKSFHHILLDFDAFPTGTDNRFDSNDQKFPAFSHADLDNHPLPWNQGPLLPFLHFPSSDSPKSEELIANYTEFQHEPNQKCAKWTPGLRDSRISICNFYRVSELTSEANFQGSHSDMKTMSVVYTCMFSKCSVSCPCKLCVNTQLRCRSTCKDTPCPDCYPQCKLHKLEIERRFDVVKHSFTIMTHGVNSAKYLVKHAGIPRVCQDCTEDLLDHQKFHLLPHPLCKFCLQLLAPIENAKSPIRSFEDCVRAKKDFQSQVNHTCAYCLKVFGEVYKRKIHENTQHEGKRKEFVCNDCEKTFTNRNALESHWISKHGAAPKIICEVCRNSFSSKSSLKEHRETYHNDSDRVNCDECSATFTKKSNLLRHKGKLHNKVNVNWNFV